MCDQNWTLQHQKTAAFSGGLFLIVFLLTALFSPAWADEPMPSIRQAAIAALYARSPQTPLQEQTRRSHIADPWFYMQKSKPEPRAGFDPSRPYSSPIFTDQIRASYFDEPINQNFDISKNYVAKWTLAGFDVGFSPRASMYIGPQGNAARLGALVSIGQNLKEPRSNVGNWYVFVGGGAEALTFEPDGTGSLINGLRVEEKTLIGDGQAGIAVRVGQANLSLAYVRRETNSRGELRSLRGEDIENFAALTFSVGR